MEQKKPNRKSEKKADKKSDRIIAIIYLFFIALFLSFEFFGLKQVLIAEQSGFAENLEYTFLIIQLINVMFISIIPIAVISDYFKKRYEFLLGGVVLSGIGLFFFNDGIISEISSYLIAFGLASILSNLPAIFASLFKRSEEKRNMAFILAFFGLVGGLYTAPFSIEMLLKRSGGDTAITTLIIVLALVFVLLIFARKYIKSNENNNNIELKDYQQSKELEAKLEGKQENKPKSKINKYSFLSDKAKPKAILFFLSTSLIAIAIFLKTTNAIIGMQLSTYDVFTLGDGRFDPEIFTGFSGTFMFFIMITLFFVYMVKKIELKTLPFISLGFISCAISSLFLFPMIDAVDLGKANFFFLHLANMFFLGLGSVFVVPYLLSFFSRLINPRWSSSVFALLILLFALNSFDVSKSPLEISPYLWNIISIILSLSSAIMMYILSKSEVVRK